MSDPNRHRRDEITVAMLDTFREEGIEDTNENRRDFLLGIQDAWNEDQDNNPEKFLYQMTLSTMILERQS